MSEYQIVEKRDHLAFHGLFSTKESADKHLRDVIPIYVRLGYYMDKTLTPDDFEVLPYLPTPVHRRRKR